MALITRASGTLSDADAMEIAAHCLNTLAYIGLRQETDGHWVGLGYLLWMLSDLLSPVEEEKGK